MNGNNESLIEIAYKLMLTKKKPKSLAEICKEVFQIKGLTPEEIKAVYPQFYMDFMLCGLFIATSENKKGVKVWDLKSRQPSSILDKEIMYLNDDPYIDDEDVIKNELKDDTIYDVLDPSIEVEDEEDDNDEPDEIEEELSMLGDDLDQIDYDYLDDDEDEEDKFDDED